MICVLSRWTRPTRFKLLLIRLLNVAFVRRAWQAERIPPIVPTPSSVPTSGKRHSPPLLPATYSPPSFVFLCIPYCNGFPRSPQVAYTRTLSSILPLLSSH